MTEKGSDFITVAEAARRMKRTEADITSMIATGLLTAMHINGTPLVMWPPAFWSGQEIAGGDPETN